MGVGVRVDEVVDEDEVVEELELVEEELLEDELEDDELLEDLEEEVDVVEVDVGSTGGTVIDACQSCTSQGESSSNHHIS